MEKYNPPMSVSTCQDGVIFSASYIGWMLPILALISSAITSLAISRILVFMSEVILLVFGVP